MTPLQAKADFIRKEIVRVSVENGAGHIAPSLSSVDILTALYYKVLKRNGDPHWSQRDRVVFSKAHGCYGLYAILADLGLVPMEEWNTFYKGSRLTGCQERNLEYGIEAGCGSLGHGLPLAVGMAFAAKLQNLSWKVYCIAGDGEMQEGSMWESLQFAAWHKLSNLFLIIDKNNLQAMDFCDNILTLPNNPDDLKKKCEAFGFHSVQVNGHNTDSIADLLEQLDISGITKPKAIIADTVKGYGLYCMENIPKFHFRLPTESELSMGCRYE